MTGRCTEELFWTWREAQGMPGEVQDVGGKVVMVAPGASQSVDSE